MLNDYFYFYMDLLFDFVLCVKVLEMFLVDKGFVDFVVFDEIIEIYVYKVGF